jgi:hypothetical protein
MHSDPRSGLGHGLSGLSGLGGLNGGRVGDHSARCITASPKAAMLVYRPALRSQAQNSALRNASTIGADFFDGPSGTAAYWPSRQRPGAMSRRAAAGPHEPGG